MLFKPAELGAFCYTVIINKELLCAILYSGQNPYQIIQAGVRSGEWLSKLWYIYTIIKTVGPAPSSGVMMEVDA